MNSNGEADLGQVVIGLNAVIVAIVDDQPKVLIVQHTQETLTAQHENLSDHSLSQNDRHEVLPFGPFYPMQHRTLESGLRSWVEEQTNREIGYVEQLYTFGNAGRDPREEAGGPRMVSVGYLALVQDTGPTAIDNALWQDWYRYFPWEDWREGKPALLDADLIPALRRWIDQAENSSQRQERYERTCITFGLEDTPWNDELVLERYELLYEANLVWEAQDPSHQSKSGNGRGTAMAFDHRRILATAIGRLRGKIKYRPVVFELMPPTFTLLRLQRVVEALSGARLHKQNFRRLVEKKGLVEATGKIESLTGGRPASQFRFRRDVLMERQALGVRHN
ncbi:MAG: NAD regulator [Sneathiella sp.]|nr:NAD regulator [Sneathiella sp.]